MPPSIVNDNELRQRKGSASPPPQEQEEKDVLRARTLDSLKPWEVCIDGVVYDLTGFDHPGGDSIHMFGGNDVTVTYKMIHPMYNTNKRRLDKLQRVGIIPDYVCEYKFDTEFEREVKREVYKIVPPGQQFGTWGWYTRGLFYMGLFFYLQYQWVTVGTSVSLAILYGLSQALIGLNIQHDANHGAVSRKPWINEILGYAIDLLGWTKLIWMQEHWTHHAYTNHAEKDPDSFYVQPLLVFNDYPLGHPARKWHHKFQSIFYLPVIAHILASIAFHPQVLDLKGRGALLMGMKLDSDFVKSSVPYAVALRVMFISLNIVAPIMKQGLTIETIFHLVLMGNCLTLTLAGLFTLSHNFEHADRDPTEQFRKTGEPVDWFKSQVETSSSYGGWISGALTGGLNFQVEHHLFPRMSSAWYPYIAPTVRKICQKHGVKYVYYPWIWQNFAATIKYMHQAGTGSNWIKKQ